MKKKSVWLGESIDSVSLPGERSCNSKVVILFSLICISNIKFDVHKTGFQDVDQTSNDDAIVTKLEISDLRITKKSLCV